MSKRNYTHVKELLPTIEAMAAEGMTQKCQGEVILMTTQWQKFFLHLKNRVHLPAQTKNAFRSTTHD